MCILRQNNGSDIFNDSLELGLSLCKTGGTCQVCSSLTDTLTT